MALLNDMRMRSKSCIECFNTITVHLEVTDKREDKGFVTLDCKALNQNGKAVATGTAEVMAPREKLQIPRPPLPAFSVG